MIRVTRVRDPTGPFRPGSQRLTPRRGRPSRPGMALLRALRYARRYRNWLELERERSAGRTPHHVVLRSGEQFRAPDDTNLIRLVQGVYARGYYTPSGFEIGDDDVVVDVGANVGTFSVYAAKRSQGRMLAIEPFPDNVSCLEHNLKLNGCRKVEVFPGALGKRHGTAALYVRASGAAHQLFPEAQHGAIKDSIEVPLRTLPSLLGERGFERVDTLKLDCEGAEGLILPRLGGRQWRDTALEHGVASKSGDPIQGARSPSMEAARTLAIPSLLPKGR